MIVLMIDDEFFKEKFRTLENNDKEVRKGEFLRKEGRMRVF